MTREEHERILGEVVCEYAETALGHCKKPLNRDGSLTEEGKAEIRRTFEDILPQMLTDEMEAMANDHLLTPRKEDGGEKSNRRSTASMARRGRGTTK